MLENVLQNYQCKIYIIYHTIIIALTVLYNNVYSIIIVATMKPYNICVYKVFIQLLIGLCLPIVLSLVYNMCVYFAYNKVTKYNWQRGQPSDYGNTWVDSCFQLNHRVDVVM